MGDLPAIPFDTFLWKISSACNLNCSYCYVYNAADSRWKQQPGFMSEAIARQAASRIREHLRAHNKTSAKINFHGGEPLLGGARHLDMLSSVINEELVSEGIEIAIGIQSNGLLFTPEIGDLMLEKGLVMGISVDGPPHVNDRHRVDHRGRPSSARLEEALKLLLTAKYSTLLTGFLCVMDITTDPREVTSYLCGYRPRIDFLFPLNNHVNPPAGKQHDPSATPYGDWLVDAFDYWFDHVKDGKIRFFTSLMSQMLGGGSEVESMGIRPVGLIVVETNGAIEAVDTLKSTFEGATVLGFNVFDHDFNTVALHPAVQSRQQGVTGLCETCQRCPIVRICGGGYLPHRYAANGFDNPSVYCGDLQRIIKHIAERLSEELDQQLARLPLPALS